MQDNREAISRLMSPLPEHLLEAVPIKKAMSSIKDNRSDPTLIEGIAEPLR
jgi:hypothetical protein